MKKFLALVLTAIIALSLAACGDNKPSESNSPSDSIQDFSSSELTSEDESTPNIEELTMPTIAGTNAYDLTVNLKENGLPEATRQSIDDGYSFSATNAQYSYYIETNKDYVLSYGEFFVFDNDNGFLGFCSSFPRDDEKMQKTMDWVNENVGSEISETIGDMELVLSLSNEGKPYLEIKAIGRDEYVNNKLDEAMRLSK